MMVEQEGMTTIKMPKALRDKLDELGRKRDTYADIIEMLYEAYVKSGGKRK